MTLTKTRTLEITVTPTGSALGTDISNFDISTIDETGFETVRKAWLEHLVLRVRGQGDDRHLAREFVYKINHPNLPLF